MLSSLGKEEEKASRSKVKKQLCKQEGWSDCEARWGAEGRGQEPENRGTSERGRGVEGGGK